MDPFYTTKFAGRGLGLAVVQGIVRRQNGFIELSSEKGSGTTIRVLFPASDRQPVMDAKRVPTDVAVTGAGVVMVVDDEEPIRRLNREVLESAGFDVVTASDGRDALDLYHERFADIVAVVLDLTMPRKDGKETFAELREVNQGLPIVLVSGFSERRLRAKGPVAFIQKPYRPADLLGKLKTLLE
jgi:CheY-like chemotaxis protein